MRNLNISFTFLYVLKFSDSPCKRCFSDDFELQRVYLSHSVCFWFSIFRCDLPNLECDYHFRWLPLDVARMWGRHWLEPVVAPNSVSIIPGFPTSNYLSLPLLSALNIARYLVVCYIFELLVLFAFFMAMEWISASYWYHCICFCF